MKPAFFAGKHNQRLFRSDRIVREFGGTAVAAAGKGPAEAALCWKGEKDIDRSEIS